MAIASPARFIFFFFNDTATTEIYTLSLHDALPISPPRPRCHELLVKQAADRLHVTCIPARLSILTRPLNGRAACHYCGQCNRGCRVNANFTSTNVLIAPALATGKLTLLTNAMAREVVMDASGRATGVAYIDKAIGADRRVRAKEIGRAHV